MSLGSGQGQAPGLEKTQEEQHNMVNEEEDKKAGKHHWLEQDDILVKCPDVLKTSRGPIIVTQEIHLNVIRKICSRLQEQSNIMDTQLEVSLNILPLLTFKSTVLCGSESYKVTIQ
uniref:Uncharacterized protein n=1 Tax=Sphaerodactylus townsendi TaxID=933632 RepID=A0ACB8EYA5_9SAUR